MKAVLANRTAAACVTIGSLLLIASSHVQADVVVVVGAKSAAGNLTREQVAEIFLGRTNTFPGGGGVEPLDQGEATAIRDEFYSTITGKSAAQAKAYWAKLAFTGRGTPPRENANSGEVKKTLSANPKALGYIEKSAVDDSVRVLFP